MSIKWSESVTFRFLELYNEQDCLWNHRLDSYRNRDARENALNIIVKEMGIPGLGITDIKNKIKTIRTMYKKEYTLVCKSKKSGMGTEDMYVPKLFWYKRADEFLKGVTTTRETMSNLVSINFLDLNDLHFILTTAQLVLGYLFDNLLQYMVTLEQFNLH